MYSWQKHQNDSRNGTTHNTEKHCQRSTKMPTHQEEHAKRPTKTSPKWAPLLPIKTTQGQGPTTTALNIDMLRVYYPKEVGPSKPQSPRPQCRSLKAAKTMLRAHIHESPHPPSASRLCKHPTNSILNTF